MAHTPEELDSGTASPAATVRRPSSRHESNAPAVFKPSALAVSERERADRWKNIALLVSLASLTLAFLTIRAGRATELIHVMDPLGNMYAGPVEPLASSKQFFNLTAIYAANSALQRSPQGFDLAELLKLYFSPRAIAKLEDDHKARDKDMRRRNLQWKPILDSISEPVSAGDGRIVEVHGRLVTAGAFASRAFVQQPPFTLVLTFVRNPDLGKAGAYPWICDDFELKIVPAEAAKR